MSTRIVRRGRRFLLAGLAVILACTPALARSRHAQSHEERNQKEVSRVSKDPFGDIPKGPLQIYVSVDQQKLHLYSDGTHVADSSVATGVVSLPTPLGVFSIIQKQRYHESNLYSNAPMPFMQRITWSGVALHEGESIGHRASHGCIRMPHDFAVRLYSLTKLGVPVIVSNPELKPVEFADPHLFVHKDKPQPAPTPAPTPAPAPIAAAAPAAPAAGAVSTTAQPGDAKSDGATPPDQTLLSPSSSEKLDQVGLRVDPSPPAQPVAAPPPVAPSPAGTPDVPAKKTPIAIFISRKEKKIYVRQDFEPLFDAPVTIDHPDQPLGTHVFTALDFLPDHATLRWDVVSLPLEPSPKAREAERKKRAAGRSRRRNEDDDRRAGELPPPQTPAQALARIDIPQNAIDFISQMMVPGSSLIISDQGLGDETGEGTNFVVVTQ